MSVGKFVAGTTLATPAIGGVSYVTYEQLTKEETATSTETTRQESEETHEDAPQEALSQKNENLGSEGSKSPEPEALTSQSSTGKAGPNQEGSVENNAVSLTAEGSGTPENGQRAEIADSSRQTT